MKIDNLEIDERNYKDIAYQLKAPFTVFERLLGLRQPVPLDGSVAFYDIETESDESYLFGRVQNITLDLDLRIFKTPTELVKELQRFKIVCGFNSYRFDNRVLAKECPQSFYSKNMSGFDTPMVRGPLNIDLFPLYRLWKPFSSSHKLDYLAKALGIERKFDLDDKENKCAEDVEICAKFWPYAKQILQFIQDKFLIDPVTLCMQSPDHSNKLRRWFLQSWALQNGIVPILFRKDSDEKASFYQYCKRGFYENINVFDAKSAYPTTAINQKIGLWKEHDFADFESYMVNERTSNPDIQEFIKFVCNALIGDMNFSDGLLRDKRIMTSVWNGFKANMESWVDEIGKKNVIYSYTDCVYTKNKEVPEMKGYEIVKKHSFEWLAIYNIERILGITIEGKIHKTHFNRIPAQLKMYNYLDKEIESLLRENPKKFLNKPKLEIKLESFPSDAFKIVIRKDSDTCRSLDYLELWPQLHLGFNEVFIGKKGTMTPDFNKIDYNHYKKLMANYLRLFKLKVK